MTDVASPLHGARRRGRPGYDAESVLNVAVDVFNERGFDGTSMEDLAKRLRITKSGIYHHFTSKEEILSLALDRALDALSGVVEETRRLEAPAIERLEYLVRGSVRTLVERLPFVTLLLRVRGNTTVERRALRRRKEMDDYIAQLVEEAEAEGDVRPDVDPRITGRLLFGTVNSVVEWLKPDRRVEAEVLADAVCKVTFDGLRVHRSN
jgi:AcrR family transcriptional regulator